MSEKIVGSAALFEKQDYLLSSERLVCSRFGVK